MNDVFKKMREKLEDTSKKLDDFNRSIKNNFKKVREGIRNDSKPKTEEIPKDENMEQVSPKTEENGIKNQIIKKTEERRMMRPKKVRITR